MKKLMALIFALALPMSASAWFAPQVQFSITPHTVTAQVTNFSGYMALCQGYVYGVTQTGHYINSWFSNYVPPMTHAYAYVYAYQPYYFVNAWADIRCR